MMNLAESGESKKKIFIQDVLLNDRVYCIFDGEGTIGNVESNNIVEHDNPNQQIQIVILARSKYGLAQEACNIFDSFEVYELSVDQFIDDILKVVHERGDFVAVNLLAPRFIGPELSPLDLAQELSQIS